MEKRIIAVDGIGLSVSEWGGSGNTVLFAHATGFLGAVWEPVIGSLRNQGFTGRIITFDQRGHGLSSKPDAGYEWPVFAGDAELLMGALELNHVLGVGHSGGATTLACVAAANHDRFRRLILVDPVLFHPIDDAALQGEENPLPLVKRTRTRRMVWSSREELFESLRARPPYDVWGQEALTAYVEHGTFERPDGEFELLCPSRIEAQVYQNGRRFDPRDYLSRVSADVLFVRGENSETFTAQRATRAMETTPKAAMMVVPGRGHFVPMEDPQLIAKTIIEQWGDD